VRTREDVLKEMLAACRIQTTMLDDLHFAMADHIAALEARTDTRFDAVSIVDLIHEIRALRQQRDEAQARPLGYAFEVYRLLDLRDDVRAAALTQGDA